MNRDCTIATGENPEARREVERGLEAFNARIIGVRGYEPFEAYARDAAGAVVGGMFGQSGMDWLCIDYLWVAQAERGAGLGRRLLGVALEEARRRRCVGIFLYTYSFQALGFYQANGFTVMGKLDNCPVGHQRYYLSRPVGDAG